MESKELTEKIIACAYRVYNTMGAGFFESVYENVWLLNYEKQNYLSRRKKLYKYITTTNSSAISLQTLL